ncbi:hypothetical protein V8C42DRAFT_158214 [Trichoderma barbatum]
MKETRSKNEVQCVIWESNPGLPDVARMATENFTTKPITLGSLLEEAIWYVYIRLLPVLKSHPFIHQRQLAF